ncbi:MAG TPA: GTPase domain-containing protein [Candidatus Limnocylindrales bacterium]|nr:GTPase domain-containing protein [Candidatus Limnocylindrales bacterium]
MTEDRSELRVLVDRLEELATRRLAMAPAGASPTTRATQLRDHVGGHLRVRADSLDAPLLVLLLGPTGAGKSTLFNTVAGRPASPTGVLRPTTRVAVVLAHPDDQAAIRAGALAGIAADRVRLIGDASVAPGLALVDAPDIDSIEHANRELADRLVEAADLAIFVTTATRYADRVPWAVLGRVRERGLPLVVVVNRLPATSTDRDDVLGDVRRLFAEAGFDAGLEVVGVGEGSLGPDGESLEPGAVRSITARIADLRGDRDARRRLAAQALAGSLAGIAPLVDRIADDVAHEAIDAAALRRRAGEAFDAELDALREELRHGRFLRDEALRHWQSYVGADDITRIFSKGIGAVRGAIASIFRPSTAPVAEVREATTDDLVAVAQSHAAEAARRTATAWADEPRVATAVGDRPDLWTVSADFDRRLRERLDDWIASIGADIAETGAGKRRLARGASVGVNAIGVGVMLATFIHTAGLTGTEVGIAAGTAFLNQKLLGALFGEAAMVELIARARARLEASLAATFAEERVRFEALVPEPADLETLGDDLRRAAADARAAIAADAGVPEAATSSIAGS